MKSWLQKKWNKGKMLAELKPAFFLSLTFCFMIFIYAPLELYINNTDEFWYDAYVLFPFIIKDFFLFFAISLVGFAVAYLLAKIVYEIALYGYFACMVACYIQGNYMVKGLPPLDGTDINWTLYRPEMIKSTIMWVAVAVVCLIGFLILKYDKVKKAVTYVSIFMVLILASTITVLSVNGDIFTKKQYEKFNKLDQFEMSTDTNFVILMLDAIDEECFWQVWEQHPEYAEEMRDFTFYNNAMSGYAYTNHSLPLIISGEWYENQEPFSDYQIRVFKDSPFFNRLREQGYTLSYYEDEYKFEVGVMDGAFNNLAYTQSSLWDAPLFNKRIIKMVGMKYAPYLLKPKCWFNVDMLNNQEMTPKDNALFSWKNKAFYDDVKTDDITYVDGKRFKLIHLMGAHVPFYYDKDVNEIDNANYYTCIESSMTVTMAYLDKLREAGVYDNSVIIVLSDHGYNIEGDAVDTPQKNENETGRQHPVLFVKGLNESHDFQVSGAPISYEDLVSAYYKLMDGAVSDDCFEYKEGNQRERRYLLYKYLGEDHMVEYVQTGYAGDESTLVPTGRVFDAK